MPRRPRESRHGATQPESERGREQQLLRLRPDVRRRLRALAMLRGMHVSDLVTEWVERESSS